MSKGSWKSWGAAALVTGVLLTSENNSDGSIEKTVIELRDDVVYPVVSEGVGAAGDIVGIARSELDRQGIDPTGVLQAPAATEDDTAREGDGINGG